MNRSRRNLVLIHPSYDIMQNDRWLVRESDAATSKTLCGVNSVCGMSPIFGPALYLLNYWLIFNNINNNFLMFINDAWELYSEEYMQAKIIHRKQMVRQLSYVGNNVITCMFLLDTLNYNIIKLSTLLFRNYSYFTAPML